MKKILVILVSIFMVSSLAYADGQTCRVDNTGDVKLEYSSNQSDSEGCVPVQLTNESTSSVQVLVKVYDADTNKFVTSKSIHVSGTYTVGSMTHLGAAAEYICGLKKDHAYYFKISLC